MQAVRLARYHTRPLAPGALLRRLSRLVGRRAAGRRQPGAGARHLHPEGHGRGHAAGAAHARRDIACVLVNPLQALHPNAQRPDRLHAASTAGAPAHFDRAAYTTWLQRLREVCTERSIVLDLRRGVRRLPPGAGRRAGILRRARRPGHLRQDAGRRPARSAWCAAASELMKRFRDDRPADICFARGTFNSHPYVMGGDERVPRPRSTRPRCARCTSRPRSRCGTGAPTPSTSACATKACRSRWPTCRSIWTVVYTQPSRYNWMLQYYLRAEGLALSWVGTGRLIFSLDYTDADFAAVADRFVAAARAMQRRRLLVVGRGADEQGHQAPHPARDARPPLPSMLRRNRARPLSACCSAGSISSPRSR